MAGLNLTRPAPAVGADWTRGAAKYAAVAVLGAACVAGVSWSILRDRARPVLMPAPAGGDVVAGGAPVGRAEPAPASLAQRVNLNTAGAAELQLLPGIGPALAARIIEDRERAGPYQRVDDLDRVRGIGPRTIEKLRALACVE